MMESGTNKKEILISVSDEEMNALVQAVEELGCSIEAGRVNYGKEEVFDDYRNLYNLVDRIAAARGEVEPPPT